MPDWLIVIVALAVIVGLLGWEFVAVARSGVTVRQRIDRANRRAEARIVADTVRPRTGSIVYPDGRSVPVVYEQDRDDPAKFHPVSLDGQTLTLPVGGRLTADVLGPGQSIELDYEGGGHG